MILFYELITNGLLIVNALLMSQNIFKKMSKKLKHNKSRLCTSPFLSIQMTVSLIMNSFKKNNIIFF